MAQIFISYSRKDGEFVHRLDEELRRRGREAWVDWEGIRALENWEETIYAAIEGADTFIFVLTPDSVASEICGREIKHAAAQNKRMVPLVARDLKADTVHESLAKLNWIFCRDSDDFQKATDTLVSALDTDLEWVHAHTDLLTQAIKWEANSKSRSLVLRGEALKVAEQWLAQAGAQKERQPTALQTEYIIASRKAAAQRQRITLGAVTFGLVVAIVLAIMAFFAEAKARKQTQVAVAATKRTSEVASRGNVSLAGYSKESGKNAQALAQLAQALRLNPENQNASGFAAAMLTQLGWDVPLRGSMGHEDVVNSAQFSPDGRRVVTASYDKTARLWDVASGKQIGAPMKHEDTVWSAQFSSDGQRVVTASQDKTARLWDAVNGKPIGETMKHEESVNSAQFSPDGQRILTASSDKVALWDAASGKPIGEPMKHENYVNAAQFSPDGQRVVTASLAKAALWDAASSKLIGEPMKHESLVKSAQFSPDGQRVVTASLDKTARLWDAVSGRPIGEPMKHENGVNSAQFSPDGQQVVTASDDETARLWDAASGKPIGEPMKHGNRVNSAQLSPDGQRMVTASDDKTVRLWDAASGKPIGEPMKHKGGLLSAQFSPDGQRVVTASEDKTARLWDATSGKPIGAPLKHEHIVWSGQFSPDGQRVVTASGEEGTGTAQLWNAATGKPIGAPMKHEDNVNSAQFSPDGQRVVTASDDKTARLWDAASGKPIGVPMTHDDRLTSAQFSPDGQRVVTALYDKTARLWDATIVTNKDTREDVLLLAELAEATGGGTLETVGQAENFEVLTPEQSDATREKIAAKFVGPPLKLTPLQRFMKWSVSDRRGRTISPFSQETVSEWLENRIKEGTVEGLRSALQVDPANARITAHLGRRLANRARKQGSDPDEARRARGEADFLTSRAQKLAPNNEEVNKLRDEVVNVGTSTPVPIMSTAVTPEVQRESSNNSGWLTSAEYQREFDVRKSEFYPANIEGRCHDGREEFRAEWKKRPLQIAFQSHHGITKQQFEDRGNALREQGYSLEFSAAFQDCNDVTRYQATWLKKN